MRNKSLSLLGCGAILALSAGAAFNLGAKGDVYEAAAGAHLITAVEGDAEGLTTDASWEGVEALPMTGENGGTVSFASIGTKVFFKMRVNDSTPFTSKDKIDYAFRLGEKAQGQQGNFDPWLTANGPMDYGDPVQVELHHHAAENVYTAVIGFDLGADFAIGAKLSAALHFVDATEPSATWGEGNANAFEGDLYLGEMPAAHTYVVPQVQGDAEGLTIASSWEGVETYPMDGPNGGTVAFALIESKLFFKMSMPDATRFPGKDKIDYLFRVGSNVQGQQGNFDPWLTANVAMSYGQPVQVEMGYNEASASYEAILGFDMKADYAPGMSVEAEVNFHDAQTEDTPWGEGPANTFAHTLYLVEEGTLPPPEESSTETTDPSSSSEPELPEEGLIPGPENADLGIVVTDLAKLPNDADWAKAPAFDLLPVYGDTTGATGKIQLYTSNQNYFWRLEVNDPTVCFNTDGIFIRVSTVGDEGKTLYEGRGNFDNWISEKTNLLGQPSLREDSFSIEDVGSYLPGIVTHKEGYYGKTKEGEFFVEPGKQIRLEVRYRDSRSAFEPWIDGDQKHTIYFDQVLTFGEVADTTIRPDAPSENFLATAAEVRYNRAIIAWDAFAGADLYKVMLYAKNAEGEAEPYTHLRVEGPFYGGEEAYAEEISGLAEATAYCVQIQAFDPNENLIGSSALAEFETPKRGEETSSSTPSEETSTGTSQEGTSEGTSADTSVPGSGDSSVEEGHDEPSALSQGAIVGIVVGVVLGVLLIGGIVAFVIIKKRR